MRYFRLGPRRPGLFLRYAWSIRLCVLIIATISAASCARTIDYRALNSQLAGGRCEAAVGLVEHSEERYGSNKRLLYLLDAAQVNLYCENYEKSNDYFHQAEALAEDLWTKSISREAAAFVINDMTVPYAGEDFERALINLFSALNYAAMGQLDEALVECRRLDSNLTLYNEKYEEKNVYKEDAFGRYLSGIIYEATGQYGDAYIDYYRAFKAYGDYRRDYGTRMPPSLADDLLRVAEAAGRLDEAVGELALDAKRPFLKASDARTMARIVFVHLNGPAPVKVESSFVVPTLRGPIKLAFPAFAIRPPACDRSELLLSSGSRSIDSPSELVEDINRIAAKNLEDRRGRVVAKTIARAAIKQGAIEAATSQIRDRDLQRLAQAGLNILNLAIERADTRSWRTLPGEIYLSSAFVPAGSYEAGARLCGGYVRPLGSIEAGPGQTKFIILDTR